MLSSLGPLTLDGKLGFICLGSYYVVFPFPYIKTRNTHADLE